MFPVSDTGIVVVLAVILGMTVAAFSFMAVLVYKTMKDDDEDDRRWQAVIDALYRGDEKSRALLLDPNWPPLRRGRRRHTNATGE